MLYFTGSGQSNLTSLPSKVVASSNIESGAVSFASVDSSISTTMFSYANTTGTINEVATFSLSEQQAPLNSYVIMSVNVDSGSHAGDHYLQLYQREEWTQRNKLSVYSYYWFYNSYQRGLFKIEEPADRTFAVHHGTVAASATAGDSRWVQYHGYIKLKS